jgi:hypothetical protein
MRTLLILMALNSVSGCVAGVPGDGRLVRVEIDGGFSPLQARALAKGVTYWDVAGARLRVAAEIPQDDGLPAAMLRLDFSGVTLVSMAWWDVAACAIHFDSTKISGLNELQLATLVAHESGHALGLQHDPGDNLMDPDPWPMPAPSAEDVKKFKEIWH